jgi:hypothetical protein
VTGVLSQPGIWAALVLAGAALVLAGVGSGGSAARARLAGVARPVLPWVALASLGVLLWPGVGEDLRIGLVGAILAVAGWFVTFLFQLDERETDQGDLMVALRAEIWVFYNDLTRNARPGAEAEALADAERTPSAVLFFPQPGPPVVFDANAAAVARLPSEAVDEVVQFYSLLHATRQFALELREPAFTARPQAARLAAYRTYMKAQDDLSVLAANAIVALNAALGLPAPEGVVSTPGPARWGPAEADGADGASRP